ncbi:hypothetical protein Q1W73_16410 [Asticcacaulis sp. ZE23SCel15]|uniref:hypothetical protein n=1 Tax=Asticcacaulis sp. ZE23SCel15 TaxID=3059027 RepID=UPI00265E7363|nr:hypothetical protein [Asticcacaulis sp. ZE23SCel15]WKL57226.1 hypothetical protein Q1W73_16410 [Asticcacaulis sp. ZE23SCel15]
MFNFQALAIAAGAFVIVGVAGGLYAAGRKSAEAFAESESRAVASEHALVLERTGRKLIAKDRQIDGLSDQLKQALRSVEAQARIIAKIKKVEVIRDQAIDAIHDVPGLDRPVDPDAKRLLIDLYDRLCGEAEAGTCDGNGNRTGVDTAAGAAVGQDAVPDSKSPSDRHGS